MIKSTNHIKTLQLDAQYRNTNNWKNPDDVFNLFFRFADDKGINNTSGFRPKSKSGESTDITNCAFCLLVTNLAETEWPDSLDPETGIFIYYGDNRSAGKRLEETMVGGNRLLTKVFSDLHTHKRANIPPFLCFEKVTGDSGTYMKFLGLACPGAQGVSAFEDLVAVWRIKDDQRFQNYKATFTILKEEEIHKSWLEELVSGKTPVESVYCPETWKLWVSKGIYSPLKCIRQMEPRSKAHQVPGNVLENDILKQLHEGLSDREFEFAAAEIVQLMDERFTDMEVTRASRDGGRDVVCNYRVGHDLHQVRLSAYIEAKRWDPQSSVGVKPMMRLISRIKHRDIGVFITTSFFDQQVQKELIEDRHPVLLLSGGDIARLLISREIANESKFSNWLASIKLKASESIT